MALDHVTLRTADLEQTRAFLEAVLGLKVGYRPPFSFPGYWLYDKFELRFSFKKKNTAKRSMISSVRLLQQLIGDIWT